MRYRKISALALLMVLAGCTHTVNMALRADFGAHLRGQNDLAGVSPSIIFSQGEFSDRRPTPQFLTTFSQGVHTYNLIEERPIEDALFQGLEALMVSSGHDWSEEGGSVKVNLEFVSLQASRNAGFINVGASSMVQIRLEFVEADTDQAIYSETYVGQDERSQALIGLMDMVRSSVDQSMVNCIQSVGDDEALAQALGGRG
jgi:hypothetical protein